MADVAVQPIAESPRPEPARWSLLRKVAFRFFCCYWVLYALPEGGRVSLVPAGEFVFQWWEKLTHAVVPWVAIHAFHVTGKPATYFPTGSGDTTLQYVTNLLYVVAAVAVTLVWSVLDRRRASYRGLDAWLRVLVRYNLAFTLLGYGFAKIVPLQFGAARPPRLMEPYGEFSPMGVLWSFMGASLPYVVFSGLAEACGGALLLFRRTATLGAIVSFGVMLNVAVLNYCYDVPVKLYSTNLALMALFLLTPELRRLANVLVLNRAAAPADLNPIRFERRWLRIGQTICWIAVVGYHLVGNGIGAWQGYDQVYRHPQLPPHYGLYKVESGAPVKWRKVAVPAPKFLMVRDDDDVVKPYQAEGVTWTDLDADHLELRGNFEGAASTIRLKKVDIGKLPLVSRGFHWINENPFNR